MHFNRILLHFLHNNQALALLLLNIIDFDNYW